VYKTADRLCVASNKLLLVMSAPSPTEIYLTATHLLKGCAARSAVDHLLSALTNQYEQLSKAAFLGVLYTTVSRVPFSCFSAHSSVPLKIELLDFPEHVLDLPHYQSLVEDVAWAVNSFRLKYPAVVPDNLACHLEDCLQALRDHGMFILLSFSCCSQTLLFHF
jgi:hypothetical protein